MVKIIFDARILLNCFNKSSGRSGIFFFAYNVLLALKSRDDVEVALWSTEENLYYLRQFHDKVLPNVELVYTLPTFLNFLFIPKRVLDFLWERYISYVLIRKSVAFIRLCYERVLKLLLKKHNTTSVLKKKYEFFFEPFEVASDRFRSSLCYCNVFHDAIPLKFKYMGKYMKLRLQKQIDSVKKSDISFFVSENTKRDFMKISEKFNDERSFVIPLAASLKFNAIKLEREYTDIRLKYRIPCEKKYVFSLCTLEPRKNLIRVVKCFCQFVKKNRINDLVLVLGGAKWGVFESELRKNGIKWDDSLVVQTGYIEDDDLPKLYREAEWFVYTSQYEGFGLPPLEAMQCGCPVITSNNSSLPEVVGDAGIMIDWNDDEQHVAACESYYYDLNLRKKNRYKGLCRSKMFSWSKTADLIVSGMKSVSLSE